MGNVDSRSQFSIGNLQLQTDKPDYEPGETITGKIYMRINTPVQGAQNLELEVFG